MTTIPKKTTPEDINDLRNISCTMLPSKIYESYVLNWAQDEVKLRDTQYGGVKGCSTAHLLVGVLDEVARGLEDDRAAVTLTSIDYTKAFNRLFPALLVGFRQTGGVDANTGTACHLPLKQGDAGEGRGMLVQTSTSIRRRATGLNPWSLPVQCGYR